jgi:hypothetical protein
VRAAPATQVPFPHVVGPLGRVPPVVFLSFTQSRSPPVVLLSLVVWRVWRCPLRAELTVGDLRVACVSRLPPASFFSFWPGLELACAPPPPPSLWPTLFGGEAGYVIYRVAVRRGSRKRPNSKGIVYGKPKTQGITQLKFQRKLQNVAEERVGKRCGNLRVLSSYWVNQVGLWHPWCPLACTPRLRCARARHAVCCTSAAPPVVTDTARCVSPSSLH